MHYGNVILGSDKQSGSKLKAIQASMLPTEVVCTGRGVLFLQLERFSLLTLTVTVATLQNVYTRFHARDNCIAPEKKQQGA